MWSNSVMCVRRNLAKLNPWSILVIGSASFLTTRIYSFIQDHLHTCLWLIICAFISQCHFEFLIHWAWKRSGMFLQFPQCNQLTICQGYICCVCCIGWYKMFFCLCLRNLIIRNSPYWYIHDWRESVWISQKRRHATLYQNHSNTLRFYTFDNYLRYISTISC